MTNIIESDCVNINGKKKRIYLLISKLLVNSNTIPTNKNLGKQTHFCTTKNVEVENKRIGSQSKFMWFATISSKIKLGNLNCLHKIVQVDELWACI